MTLWTLTVYGRIVGGYFKTTKDFYKALWVWLEVQNQTNLLPDRLYMNGPGALEYIHFGNENLLGYVRGWPPMPELGEGEALFLKAKEFAKEGNPYRIFECKKELIKLKEYMIANKLSK